MTLVATGCDWGKGSAEPVQSYLLTMEEADQIDMRVAWKSAAALAANGQADSVAVFDDAVIITETGANIVSAIEGSTGNPMWESAVGDPFEPLLGVAATSDTVVAMTRSEVLQFDAANGRRLQFDRLGEREPASTGPLMLWPFMVYGTPDGRIAFHHLPTGLMKSAYRFDSEISQTPYLTGDLMVIVTRGGYINVMLPDPNGARRLWQQRVFDDVTAGPAATSDHLMVPSTDGSLWTFNLNTGKIVWRWQTEFPMTDSPTVFDDAVVYQGVDGYGFAAIDTATGQQIWFTDEVQGGTVLTRERDDLIVWNRDADGSGGVFTRMDALSGRVLGTVRSPDIAFAVADTSENGSVFGVSRSGRVIKLIP